MIKDDVNYEVIKQKILENRKRTFEMFSNNKSESINT